MIEQFTSVAAAVLLAFVLIAICYWDRSAASVCRWMREPAAAPLDALPGVSYLRPLKADSPRLAECVHALLRAGADGDQIVFGVDPGSPAAAVCAEAAAQYPEREIVIVECVPGAAANPKISKLLQMTLHARHEHLIVTDSEALLDPGFTQKFRAEWMASNASAFTAGYRFEGLQTWPQQLDAAATLLTLWPGLAWLRCFGRVRLTLGACTGLRRSDLHAVGGWEAFAGDLARARELWQQTLVAYPATPHAGEARARLAALESGEG